MGKTIDEIGKKYDSLSHELLTKAGFIDQVAAGIFSFLPLGQHVLNKISSVIRDELDKLGAQELLMPSLQPKSLWETTGRWETVDVLYKTKSAYGQEYGLGPTHEEIITPLAKKFIKSYRDLPMCLYQIAVKFRDEARPKAGILRGREFFMKDLYSFHTDHDDLVSFYAQITKSYLAIFKRLGLDEVKITEASGGSFTKKYSHEFNVITKSGEVDLIYCSDCDFAQNAEIVKLKQDDVCVHCGKGSLVRDRAIEVGNIFDLGTKFSQSFDLSFIDQDGKRKFVVMGCYGIGTTRLMGAIVETNHDKHGIVWPPEAAPFSCHLLNLSPSLEKYADLIYRTLVGHKFSVLYEDRLNISSGEKLMIADLIGIPIRLVISERNARDIEWKERTSQKPIVLTLKEVIARLNL